MILPLALAVACATLPLRGASPLRLSEIGATRFVEKNPGEIWLQRGLLTALGAFRITDESPVLISVPVPDEARNKNLIQLEAWFAYQRLGPEALVNFEADENAVPYTVGLRPYIPVNPSPNPKLDTGELVNISTRGRASATDKLIGGFVVDAQHRWVLVRAIGPGLAAFGVADAMADPYLTLYKNRTPILYNGDWGTRYDAPQVAEAAVKVGAFPLATNSKDAAMLVQLSPGSYTAMVEPESGAAGSVLLEIYRLPSMD